MNSRKVKLCKIRLQRVKEVSHLPFYDQINYESEFHKEDDDQYVTSKSVKVCNYTKYKFDKRVENCGNISSSKRIITTRSISKTSQHATPKPVNEIAVFRTAKTRLDATGAAHLTSSEEFP